jgi:large subunit ribosomal protein L6e
MPRKTHAPRNRQVIEGVGALSRSASYKKSGAWAKKGAWKPVAKKPETKTPKQKTFGKQTRVIKPKAPRFYPADDVPTPLNSNKHNHHPTSLRKTLTPGTIVILLAGRHRGSRVVFLKQLPSGLLLVTGRCLLCRFTYRISFFFFVFSNAVCALLLGVLCGCCV